MTPQIRSIPEKKLVGKRIRMTLSANQTAELWQSLMPRQKEIRNRLNSELISVEVYDQNFDFKDFNSATEFEKWAAIEVSDYDEIPNEMETLNLPGGLYAVFRFVGAANNFASTFQYIFGTWLPESEFASDNRPHFEVMGEKYKGNNPTSEEDIWIPIKIKQ
ncbi:MAG: GyrI-like domain-containing protein [Bacteroidia bacterium]